MTIVYLNYFCPPVHTTPTDWLRKIKPVIGVAEALAAAHKVICVEQIYNQVTWQQNGVEYRFVRFTKKKSWFPFRLHRFVKSLEPDVVVVHGTIFPLQCLQLRLFVGKQVTILVQHHAEYPFKGWRKYLQRLAYYFVDAYLFPAKEISIEWVKKGNFPNTQKVHTVLEGSSYFMPINKAMALGKTNASGGPIYLWVGRLDANKNPILMVKAFIQFLQIYPSAKLYLIYYTNYLLADIQNILEGSHQGKQQIILVGKLPHEEMVYWYNSGDFLISSSYKEGTSFVLSEAMSCGCIPIVTNIPSYKIMTKQGNCGLLYQAGSEEALLLALLGSTQLDITTERQKVLEQFNNHLSFKAIADSIEAVINHL